MLATRRGALRRAALAPVLALGLMTGLVAQAQAQTTPIKFQLDWRFEGPSALFLLPVAKGYFKQEKLDVAVDAGNGSGGAVLRVADGAGAHAVIAPKDHAVGINATVAKVASGAAESVPYFMVTNLARTLKLLQEHGVWVIGTSDDADKTLYDTDWTGPVAIVMGAEGPGMRQLTRKTCDELVSIPMKGAVESLNVSVASGVCLYEALRQRG